MVDPEKRIKQTIKELLKKQGANYSDLAKGLHISLPTVRRILSSESLSIERLIKICDFLKITFDELMQMSLRQTEKPQALSEEQEQFFVKHPATYSFLRLLGRGYTLSQIASQFSLEPKNIKEHLKKLDSLNLIQVQRNETVKILIHWPAPWRLNGPLMRKYGRNIYWRAVDHFYEKSQSSSEGSKNGQSYYFFLDSLFLSDSTYAEYVREISQLKEKYSHLSRIEQKSLPPTKLRVVNALLGIDEVDLLTELMSKPI